MSTSFEDSSHGSLLVNIEPPEVGPSIASFEATVRFRGSSERCIAEPSVKSVVQCQLKNLVQNTTPVLEVRSCVFGNDVCSSTLEKPIVLRTFIDF